MGPAQLIGLAAQVSLWPLLCPIQSLGTRTQANAPSLSQATHSCHLWVRQVLKAPAWQVTSLGYK